MNRWGLFHVSVFLIFVSGCAPEAQGPPEVRIGSKNFTESVILAEMMRGLARHAGASSKYEEPLGGTRVAWNALITGKIDAYPEYTGTLVQEILVEQNLEGLAEIRSALGEFGVQMTDSLGFNNTYAFGMKEKVAERLGIRTISDLASHPELVFRFSNEFMDRGDGWKGLRQAYRLPQINVKGMEHSLAYGALEEGDIQLTDLYSTDAEIEYYDLRALKDDLNYFPEYNAVLLYRADLQSRAPEVVRAWHRLEGKVSQRDMIAMNVRAKPKEASQRVHETRVAADFLDARLGVKVEVFDEAVAARIWRHTREHLLLVSLSLVCATLVSIPLGILAAKRPWVGQGILGVVGIIQTIPALALLAMLLLVFGIGWLPAMAALFLYSLLPIVRNTYTGLHTVPIAVRESATALGLSPAARLWLVELPMASRTILAGIKTSAVINVGFATLGALIGAGGYGQPILTGIRLNNYALILQGAIPAAILAILIQALFEAAERVLVPKGLRIKPLE